jgi:hypothetical protein
MNSVIHNKKAEKVSQENKIKIRRSISLVSFWEGNEFVVENFLTNKQTTISALIAYILQKIDTYLSKYAVLDLFKNVPATNEVVSRLIQQDILVVEGSLLDRKECLINKIWKWKNDARYFHYSTQNVIFEQDLECMKTTLAKQAQTIPPPKPFKDYSQSITTRFFYFASMDMGQNPYFISSRTWPIHTKNKPLWRITPSYRSISYCT